MPTALLGSLLSRLLLKELQHYLNGRGLFASLEGKPGVRYILRPEPSPHVRLVRRDARRIQIAAAQPAAEVFYELA